ncbi:MAG: hypothetical protein AB8B88_12550 [Devosiaceae bacterium]
MANMPMVRLLEDEHGVSYFQNDEVPLSSGDFAPPAPTMPISQPEPSSALLHLVLPAGWGGPKHPSPCKQMGYLLTGRVRVEAGNGQTREFGPGAIWRMEDTSGSGHTTTVLGEDDVRMAIVQL